MGNDVKLTSIIGNDFSAQIILNTLKNIKVNSDNVLQKLEQTPSSVVLYDEEGRRQIYCDLKNIQDTPYSFNASLIEDINFIVACNVNFNRPLLHIAKENKKTIATDVHVISDIYDEYNSEFMQYSDILFLSDENIGNNYKEFILKIAKTYGNKIIVLGRGANGAAMYLQKTNQIIEMPAVKIGKAVNTVGAGDALFSAFIHFYLKEGNPFNALHLAQIFAAYKITVNGASNGFKTEKEIYEA